MATCCAGSVHREWTTALSVGSSSATESAFFNNFNYIQRDNYVIYVQCFYFAEDLLLSLSAWHLFYIILCTDALTCPIHVVVIHVV